LDSPTPGASGYNPQGTMTAVDVLGRVGELANGTGGSADAITGTAIAPFQASRLRKFKER